MNNMRNRFTFNRRPIKSSLSYDILDNFDFEVIKFDSVQEEYAGLNFEIGEIIDLNNLEEMAEPINGYATAEVDYEGGDACILITFFGMNPNSESMDDEPYIEDCKVWVVPYASNAVIDRIVNELNDNNITSSRKSVKSSRRAIESSADNLPSEVYYMMVNGAKMYYSTDYDKVADMVRKTNSKPGPRVYGPYTENDPEEIQELYEVGYIGNSRRAIKSAHPFAKPYEDLETGIHKGKMWRGVPGVEMIWHGEWSDPELEYEGTRRNYWDVEDTLYELAKEDGIDAENDEEFNRYCQEHSYDVYECFYDYE